VFRIGNKYGTLVTLTYHDSSNIARLTVPEIAPIPLGAPLITIGRGPGNTVVLNYPQVSGNHARLERSSNAYRIVDQNSTNHVYVNGQRVTSDSLMSQDVIRIGPYDLVFTRTQLIQQSSSRSIRIDALNLIQYRDKQKILLNVISPFPQTVLLPPPLEIYISLSLTSLVGLMIGLMISCLAANSDQANSIIPVILNIPNPFLRRDLQADRLWGGTRRILRDALVDDRYGIVGWFDRFPGGV